MTPEQFEKLDKGSRVCFGKMEAFWGVVIAKAVFDGNGRGEREQVYVDFVPNERTHGTDPAPFWYDAIGLEVLEYSGNPQITKIEIPTDIKNMINEFSLNLDVIKAKYNI